MIIVNLPFEQVYEKTACQSYTILFKMSCPSEDDLNPSIWLSSYFFSKYSKSTRTQQWVNPKWISNGVKSLPITMFPKSAMNGWQILLFLSYTQVIASYRGEGRFDSHRLSSTERKLLKFLILFPQTEELR